MIDNSKVSVPDAITSPALQVTKQARIPSIDGLRAVSILMVLIAHASGTTSVSPLAGTLLLYLGNGALGVTTFFVISGYLITFLLRKEWEKKGTINLRDFYRRRTLRIFPAFYTYLTVISVLTITGVLAMKPAYIISAGIFLWNYAHLWIPDIEQNYWFIGHFWTLALEEQFYLFWPLTLLIVGLRRGPYVALALIIITPLMRVAFYFLFPSMRDHIPIMLHTAGDSLMFGCLAALLEGKPKFEHLYKRFSGVLTVSIMALFLVFVSTYLADHYKGKYVGTIGQSLNCTAIVLVLLWLIRNPDSAVGRLFNSRLFVHVGVLSYSLYLWQQPFLTSLNKTWTGVFPLNLLLSFLAAEASYYLIERPFLALRHRKKQAVAAKALS